MHRYRKLTLLKAAAVILLLTTMLTVLSACGGSNRMTLMIYMIGSDLESKSGMGTEDMQEISDSGVDLGDVNIVVCAGGTEKWRNEDITAENINIMHLEKGGFKVDEMWDKASMGESSTLTKFVDYCAQNYENENYALILWDHGNGPVMGYGMDTLYNRDSLTLAEMREAMDASVFGKDKKLSWVGFDACLMASAELASVWSDHADYLIASQEVEPSFGWHYSFLKKADKLETPELLEKIADTYLDSCEEYYKEKGYEDRDTTISCMDLSKAEEVEKAVNDLFGKASEDVDASYNLLASRRVHTRALGRATTGSEYDIVDLNDAAEQLAAYYPEEAEELQNAIGDLVMVNKTNSDSLSGVSIYYPFFNKPYYENSWESEYSDLNVFPEYSEYLEGYVETWLGDDDMINASDALPALTEEGKYTLQLTPEQAETFAEARIYVMAHHSGEAYMPVFVSGGVTYDERSRTLTADYDGKALYAVNELDDYSIPVSTLISNNNGVSHYAVNCTVYKISPDDIWEMTPEEQEKNKEDYNNQDRAWFNLAVNTEDDSVKTSSLLVRDDEEVGLDNMQTGKAEELTKDDWNYYFFDLDSSHLLTRNKDGVILPFDEWNTLEGFSYFEMTRYNGLEFEYAPLEEGDYSIMFEITDTKGNKYCSEPAAIDSSSVAFREEKQKKTTEIDWKSGDKVKVFERDGLTLCLMNTEIDEQLCQVFELTNNTDEEVMFSAGETNAVVNGNIDIGSLLCSVRAKPGETSTTTSTIYGEEPYQESMDFGLAESYGIITGVDSLEFTLSAHSMETHKIIWDKEPVKVTYSDDTAPPLNPLMDIKGIASLKQRCSKPYLGAKAEEQTIYKDDDLEMKLIGLGADEYDSSFAAVEFINNSDSIQYLSIDGIVCNGIYADTLDQNVIMPHTTKYELFSWISYEFDSLGIKGIKDMSLAVRKCKNRYFGALGYGDVTWCPVKLSSKASKTGEFKTGDKTLYEKDGLRVALLDYYPAGEYEGWTTPVWTLSVENDTDEDIYLDMTEMKENGKDAGNQQGHWKTSMYNNRIGAHQKRITEIHGNYEKVGTISFKLLIKSFTSDRILYTSDEVITLSEE